MCIVTDGDILKRCTYYISCFLGVCEIPLCDFMRFGARPEHGCFKIVRGSGFGIEAVMQRYACESEFGRKGRMWVAWG